MSLNLYRKKKYNPITLASFSSLTLNKTGCQSFHLQTASYDYDPKELTDKKYYDKLSRNVNKKTTDSLAI